MSDFKASSLIVSAKGFSEKIHSKNGKGLNWTTSVHDELPIKMPETGISTLIRPDIIPNLFKKT